MLELDLVKVNCMRIIELIETKNIEDREKLSKGNGYLNINQDNIELRQRLKMLRKETLHLENKL